MGSVRAPLLVLAALSLLVSWSGTVVAGPDDPPRPGVVNAAPDTVPSVVPVAPALPADPSIPVLSPAPPGRGFWGPAELTATCVPPPIEPASDPVDRVGPLVWGVVGFRGYTGGTKVAPNGAGFVPLFSFDLDFNVWLWRSQRVYGYNDSSFWGQRATPGVTNGGQGSFDFSKREFDETFGVAWNYYRNLEARVFAYSGNNLNRGVSLTDPYGFKDGVGLESRWYIGGSYPNLGRPNFDVAKATFLSVGYYPTKEMVGQDGMGFKPGVFARAYLTLDVFGPRYYLYADLQMIDERVAKTRLLSIDTGLALRPFPKLPYFEFRLGTADLYDVGVHAGSYTGYGAIRFIF